MSTTTTKNTKTTEERLAIRDERIKQLQKQKQKIRKDENKKSASNVITVYTAVMGYLKCSCPRL